MFSNLDINADLTVTIDDSTEIRITGQGGSTLRVHLPDLRTALGIWQRHESVFQPMLKRLPIKTVGVRIEFVVDDTVVALLDKDKGAGVISRLVGTYPVRPRVLAIIRKVLTT
ncbi:MAG: hypothetical protein AAFQ07_00325 [Chloroflexota bacterium]